VGRSGSLKTEGAMFAAGGGHTPCQFMLSPEICLQFSN
jgi:hypothetical protein